MYQSCPGAKAGCPALSLGKMLALAFGCCGEPLPQLALTLVSSVTILSAYCPARTGLVTTDSPIGAPDSAFGPHICGLKGDRLPVSKSPLKMSGEAAA